MKNSLPGTSFVKLLEILLFEVVLFSSGKPSIFMSTSMLITDGSFSLIISPWIETDPWSHKEDSNEGIQFKLFMTFYSIYLINDLNTPHITTFASHVAHIFGNPTCSLSWAITVRVTCCTAFPGFPRSQTSCNVHMTWSS